MGRNCSNRLCQVLFNWIQINVTFKSSRSQNFHKIGVLISQNSKKKKTRALNSPYNKVTVLRPVTLLKTVSSTCVFQWTSRRLLLDFFINVTFSTLWTFKNQFFSIFENVLSGLLSVMSIMNLNVLVVAAWEHTFLDDITWNLAMFHALVIEFLYYTILQFTWISD